MIISPSILNADFLHLEEEVKKVENLGAKWLHFDVMDGHFVPNISFGQPLLKAISKCHHMVNDVHIMISEPKKYAEEFISLGADVLTFHYEACKNDKEVFEIIDLIHKNKSKAGLSIKPNTPIEKIFPFLYSIDLILIMSVEPGFGGQKFIENSYGKVLSLKNYMRCKSIKNVLIEIDGGINDVTFKRALNAGVDVFVVGSYLFKSHNIKESFEKLK